MKKSFVAILFKRLAKRAGVKINIQKYGHVGQIVFPDGRKRYFRGSNFDLNMLGSSEISRDKDYANYFLKSLGYPVIRGEAFYSWEWAKSIKSNRTPNKAYAYAKRLGFPLIVKPNSLSQGVGVTKVFNRTEFIKAVKGICKLDRVYLVQKIVEGHDYRIVVLDGKVISAYERIALSVVGDGSSSIRMLMEKKQRTFKKLGRDTIINQEDPRITSCLKRVGMNRASVPLLGQRVQLLDSRNLSTGGDPVEVTETIHREFKKIAINITKDMGLSFCGVDLMVQGDITKAPTKWWVIETNAAPGLSNYSSFGKAQARIVEDLYVDVIKAMRGRK